MHYSYQWQWQQSGEEYLTIHLDISKQQHSYEALLAAIVYTSTICITREYINCNHIPIGRYDICVMLPVDACQNESHMAS